MTSTNTSLLQTLQDSLALALETDWQENRPPIWTFTRAEQPDLVEVITVGEERRREKARKKAYKAFKAAIRAATLKSFKLLKQHLTKDQWKNFVELGYFEVKGGTSGHTYRIFCEDTMNVVRVGSRRGRTMYYCVQSRVPVSDLEIKARQAYEGQTRCLPLGDILLMQKLSLETDEAGFLAVAVAQRSHLNTLEHTTRVAAMERTFSLRYADVTIEDVA